MELEKENLDPCLVNGSDDFETSIQRDSKKFKRRSTREMVPNLSPRPQVDVLDQEPVVAPLGSNLNGIWQKKDIPRSAEQTISRQSIL